MFPPAPSALPVQEFDTPNAAAFSVITNLVTKASSNKTTPASMR